MARPQEKNATLRDIAEAANLSVTTVWKALTDGGDLNAETRERVLLLSQRLGYKPGRRAAAAASASQSTVLRFALVLIDSVPNDPAPAAAVHFLAGAAPAHGARLEVALVQSKDPAEQATQIREVARGVQGLLLYGVVTHELLREVASLALPCVVMGTPAGDPLKPAPYGHLVGHDARAIGECATAALLAAGHKRVGFVSVDSAPGLWSERWLAGYRHAHANLGLLADPKLVYVAKERLPEMFSNPGTRAARVLAEVPDPPTAFVVTDPETAGRVIAELTILGRRPANDALITVAAHGEETRWGVDHFALVRAEDGPWITACLEILKRACQHRPMLASTVTYVPVVFERFPEPRKK